MIIKNAKLVIEENKTKIQDILIKDGKIKRIADYIEVIDEEVIDANDKLILPGGIDVHVHLREPGFTHKETIKTGSLAALHGGYTTIMPMPNINPFPDNVEVIKAYQALLQKDGACNIYPYACITRGEIGKHLVDMKAIKELGISWFSDDGVGVQREDMMYKAMQSAHENDVMIVAHTEDMRYRKVKACMHEGKRNKELDLIGIPSACEFKQIERDLQLAYETKAKYHICHMSSKESVELLKKYKQMGADVSGEVTTHHLLLNEHDVENTNHKMNPPLRSKEDQQALINGLLEGVIDFVANDHAPHSEEEKKAPMDSAPFGIVALETSIPLIYTKFVKKGIFTLEQFQNFISTNPAKRFGFDTKGSIQEGYDADIICIAEKVGKIDKKAFISLGKNTPFDQYDVACEINFSMVNGIIKYTSKEVQNEA
ncbi:dihydroorotase [Breznakia sp. OttesenSCG-928-G09]|nr:dihydroorotase [Breznakia sp. OttesenSCG-928-G09]